LDDVIEPADNDALPTSTRRGHSKMPERLDDDDLALATERERVDAGLEDYAEDDVPAAADPVPDGASEEADVVQRGLSEAGFSELGDRKSSPTDTDYLDLAERVLLLFATP